MPSQVDATWKMKPSRRCSPSVRISRPISSCSRSTNSVASSCASRSASPVRRKVARLRSVCASHAGRGMLPMLVVVSGPSCICRDPILVDGKPYHRRSRSSYRTNPFASGAIHFILAAISRHLCNQQCRSERKRKTMASNEPVTIPALQQMKRDGKKSVGFVAWDYQIARIAERAGADFISVGDSVGVNLWGHSNPLEVTMAEILVCCKAVRRGVTRALVSCDVPFGPVQEGVDSALRAAIRLVKEGGADMVKLDAAADFPEAVKALTRAGIPVFAQFGLTPQTALKYGIPYSAQNSSGAEATAEAAAKLVEEAKMLEDAGAVALDFTNSGPIAGAAVVKAVKIPVIGGFGGGPWLDGRVRMAHTAIGYAEKWIDSKTDTYFNGAKATLAAFTALIDDARGGRQIKG